MAPPFAWHANSPVMVTADGALVLAYDSKEQAPQWQATVSSTVVSLSAGPTHVYALCDDGTLFGFSLHSGEQVTSQSFPGARDVVVTPGSTPAIVTNTGVVVDSVTLNIANPVNVAFRADGQQALVVTGDGVLHLFDTRTAAEIKSLNLDRPASAAMWSAIGNCWLVTAGTHVKNVPAAIGSHDIFVSFKDAFSAVAVDATGRFVAARAGNTVLLIGFPNREMIGNLTYMDKTAGQLAFGPAPWVGVGLNDGDANSVNLMEEGVYRTDPHAGRVRNRWMLSVSVKPEMTKKVLGAPAPGAPVRSMPMAPAAPPKPAFAGPAKKTNTVAIVLIIVGILALLACCGVGGLFFLGVAVGGENQADTTETTGTSGNDQQVQPADKPHHRIHPG